MEVDQAPIYFAKEVDSDENVNQETLYNQENFAEMILRVEGKS